VYECLVAAIVTKTSGSLVTEHEIASFLDNQVQDAKRLRGGVYFVEHIPLTKSGKPQRFEAQKIAIDLYNTKRNITSKM
jgi:acyl-coenzyme A synthetase/AMP-(fatty) acid ligase